MKALLYTIKDAGDTVVAGTLTLVNGVLVGEPADAPAVVFVLGRRIEAHGQLIGPDTPQAFLDALPAAYSGSRFRVGLQLH
jgi:hypothetical protein